jgi:hypothetical protein
MRSGGRRRAMSDVSSGPRSHSLFDPVVRARLLGPPQNRSPCSVATTYVQYVPAAEVRAPRFRPGMQEARQYQNTISNIDELEWLSIPTLPGQDQDAGNGVDVAIEQLDALMSSGSLLTPANAVDTGDRLEIPSATGAVRSSSSNGDLEAQNNRTVSNNRPCTSAARRAAALPMEAQRNAGQREADVCLYNLYLGEQCPLGARCSANHFLPHSERHQPRASRGAVQGPARSIGGGNGVFPVSRDTRQTFVASGGAW